jgi:molybdenum cofactor biosynthesis enzyme MoaA
MFHGCELVDGFHPPERDAEGAFAWTRPSFRLRLHHAARFVRLQLCYYGERGTLSVRSLLDEGEVALLYSGWQSCVMKLPLVQVDDELHWTVEPVLPIAGDSRQLGVMVREMEWFDDAARYERLVQTNDNRRLNHHEFQTGQAVLASNPPQLRVTMAVRCNIPETSQACVYCAWDWAKLSERGSPPFTLGTLDAMGSLYHTSVEVVDCSIGEPTMNREFGAILAQIDGDGKQMSLTTNGQLLTLQRRRELWGKNILLYTSLDAATAEGYARYRNDRFDDLVANLKALCHEKKEFADLPRVHVSFLVMHSNLAELPHFFDLAREIGVDEIKLRTLALDEDLEPVQNNNGYRFDYARELLSVSELDELTPQARALARERSIPLHIDWEQFPANVKAAEGPLCSEPWKTLYVLRRGIMPCCYATRPLATWDQQQGRPMDQFLREVFNGPAYQEIRSGLAAGDMPEYCRNTPSCPILKNLQQQGLLELSGENLFQLRAIDGSEIPALDKAA